MRLKRSALLSKAAFFVLSIVIRVNATISDQKLFSDSGCITFIDHNIFDFDRWVCGPPLGDSLWVEDDRYKITVYMGFQKGKNPPKTSKPRYMQSFEWSVSQDDFSVSENGCLHTVAKPGKEAQQIGDCAPRVPYKGPAMSNPYWQKSDFYRRHPDLLTSSNSGMDPLASSQIASPEIASPEIASPEIASPEIASPEIAMTEITTAKIKSAEPAISVANNLFLTDPPFNLPLSLTDFTTPGPEYIDFKVKRGRKRRSIHM